MATAELVIDLAKITRNTRAVVAVCRRVGAQVVGVTKGVCGLPRVARAMIAGGVSGLGDARLDNIARMRDAGVRAEVVLLRSPALSEAARCVALADVSLNGSLEALRALSAEAVRARTSHGVILMADLDTGREGFTPLEMPGACREVAAMEALELRGLGVYFPRDGLGEAYIPPLRELVAVARRIEKEEGIALPVVSGGSTNVFGDLYAKGKHVRGVSQLRIGTAILLGIVSSKGPIPIEGLHRDTFVLSVELIEVKRRARLLGVLALGRLDADPAHLFPVSQGVRVIEAYSDHTVVDLTDAPRPYCVGDRLDFQLGYFAMIRLTLSPYVSIRYRETP